MHVARLEVLDFRNYQNAVVELGPGVTTVLGANGQGKTNLVEAVGYLATLGSHRVPTDAPLIRRGVQRAVVRGDAVHDGRRVRVEVEINAGRANRARVNGTSVTRPRDCLGVVRRVLFAPEDLGLVKGDPAGRRTFLDDLLVSLAPRYSAVRADLDRVLRQRNSLLKSAGAFRGGGAGARRAALATLSVWDEQYAALAAELVVARMSLVQRLAAPVARSYCAVAPGAGTEDISLRYVCSIPGVTGAGAPELGTLGHIPTTGLAATGTDGGVPATNELTNESAAEWPMSPDVRSQQVSQVSQALLAGLADVTDEELARGMTLLGPHRDDMALGLHDMPLRGYASHGESWSMALALRLASYDIAVSEQLSGGPPVLILDDVFAELDVTRRDRLAELVSHAEQVLVTAAAEADVPMKLRGAALVVTAGRIGQARALDGATQSDPYPMEPVEGQRADLGHGR